MFFRVFISLTVIICAYLAYETIRLKILQHSLLNTEEQYVLGNPEGDVTFVKFLDYSCKFCRDAHPLIEQALRQDGNVRFIPRPVSILDTDGVNAALLPYAAAKQGKFAEMHKVLMENYRIINDQVLQDLSLEIGIDHQQLKADLDDKDILKFTEKNLDLFNAYRLSATPSYAIGTDILFTPDRTISANEFLAMFNEARGQ